MKHKFKKLVEIAVALRPEKQNYRCFHVAFIVKRKKIYSIGWNDATKTHPSTLRYPYNPEVKLHAEMMAINKMKKKDCSGFKLIVIRLDNNDKLMNSKPCKGCAAFIKDHNFSEVWFSTNDKIIVKDSE